MTKTIALLSALLVSLSFACEKAPSAAAAKKPVTRAVKKSATQSKGATSAAASTKDLLASGTIVLPEGQKANGQALFVSIRALSGGPPLAAKRMQVGKFPMAFTLDASNVVAMGGRAREIPAEFNLKITLDQDGDPMKKSPDDLSFVQKVKRGKKDVSAKLTKK